MTTIQEIKTQLSTLIGHQNIFLKSRGNTAIREALTYVKDNSKTDDTDNKPKILIQDQGGWLRYRDYPQKYNLEIIELKTDYGVIDLDDLKEKSKTASAILYQNPSGYLADQPIEDIYKICKENNCLVILDITGCIGDNKMSDGRFADIIISSFGNGKPVNLGHGGLISFSEDIDSKTIQDIVENFDQELLKQLEEQLSTLKERIKRWYAITKKVKEDLKDMQIIHPDKKGINVAVKYENEKDKQKIIEYCSSQNLEFTECPRYIRVMDDAISIEIKRKQ